MAFFQSDCLPVVRRPLAREVLRLARTLTVLILTTLTLKISSIAMPDLRLRRARVHFEGVLLVKRVPAIDFSVITRRHDNIVASVHADFSVLAEARR